MTYEKWMYDNNTYPRLYNRHPDTGDSNFKSAYVNIHFHQTEQGILKLYTEHGWQYLKRDRWYLVFVKENI